MVRRHLYFFWRNPLDFYALIAVVIAVVIAAIIIWIVVPRR